MKSASVKKTAPATPAAPKRQSVICPTCNQPALHWYGPICQNCYENHVQRSVREAVYPGESLDHNGKRIGDKR